MKILAHIQTKYVIAITLAIAVLMFGSAFIELRESRLELLHVMEAHAISLAETIERSSANVVLSSEEIENQLANRLFNNAFFIARLDSLHLLSHDDLRRIASANGIFRINIFNAKGERILSSYELLGHADAPGQRMSPREMLKPILQNGEAKLVLGLKQARFEQGQRYAVAIRRTERSGGAIVLNLEASKLLEFRKRIGIGKLLKDLGDNAGIDYVVIQDREGILAATSGVQEISSLDHDSFLGLAIDRDTLVTRQVSVGGRETYEVVKHLAVEGSPIGILRIGFAMDELRSVQDRMTRRMMIMTLVLVGIGVLVFTAIVVNQNYRLVSQRYASISSLTGSILENMRDAVVTADAENRITIFNRAAEKLFDTEAAEVAGKRLDEVDATRRKCLALIFSSTDDELTLECAPDRTRVVSVSVSTTARADGSLESRTAVIKDQTEARRLEQLMRRSEKLSAMGELSSWVAHEIRNPLNAISMIAQRYGREFIPKTGVKEYASMTQVLQKEIARVNNIIHQFLKFARPPKLNVTELPAEQFLDHIGTLVRGQAEAKGVRFSWTCANPVQVHFDAEQMTQALLNLVQNAIDATQKGGKVSVRLGKQENDLVIDIADTGSGIPPEQLERIFDLYYSTKPDGTGMGLAITQQIVSQHQGTLRVESEKGRGSTFSVRIPQI